MTKREFLDKVFALVPNEANVIMDAFDEYVESNEPHWIPVTERLPEKNGDYLVTISQFTSYPMIEVCGYYDGKWSSEPYDEVLAWMPPPEYYKGVTS